MHWPAPVVHDAVTHDRGRVLVTIHYEVRHEETGKFLDLIRLLGAHRRRDGAFAWDVYEDAARPNHMARQHIAAVLTRTRGRVDGPFGAARILGVNANTLRTRMRKLGVEPKRFRPR